MKQAIILRTDLKMSLGKSMAQACHASLSASLEAREKNPEWFSLWVRSGGKKVVLKAKDLKELIILKKKAKNLPHALIADKGLTELKTGTKTALAIGPAPDKEVDKITGSLPLLK